MTRRCGVCRGLLDTEGASACICGQALAPFPHTDLRREEWETLLHLVATRSGGLCEIRVPGVCLGDRGGKGRLRGSLMGAPWTSLHHRQPRGMGGTSRTAVHSLAVLLQACGHGTIGCHGWVEHNRSEALRRHLLVPQGLDPAAVPYVMPGGKIVYLDPVSPVYVEPPPGEPQWLVA